MKKISKGTIIRGLCLALALVNMVLKATGHDILPIDDVQINDAVSNLWMIGAAFAAYWKNNSFSCEAKKADEIMQNMKFEKKVQKKGIMPTVYDEDSDPEAVLVDTEAGVPEQEEEVE